jgi:hypothetical protein
MLPFLEAVGLYLWSHAWEISDRVFKLASWGLLIAAVVAVNRKHPTPEIGIVCALLTVLWLVAMLVSLVAAGMAFQDKCAEHIGALRSSLLQVPLSLLVALAVTYSVFGLMQGATLVFALIIDATIKASP